MLIKGKNKQRRKKGKRRGEGGTEGGKVKERRERIEGGKEEKVEKKKKEGGTEGGEEKERGVEEGEEASRRVRDRRQGGGQISIILTFNELCHSGNKGKFGKISEYSRGALVMHHKKQLHMQK